MIWVNEVHLEFCLVHMVNQKSWKNIRRFDRV